MTLYSCLRASSLDKPNLQDALVSRSRGGPPSHLWCGTLDTCDVALKTTRHLGWYTLVWCRLCWPLSCPQLGLNILVLLPHA